MAFIEFLYANIKLGPAKGDEARVATIPAFKGLEYTTGCYQLSDDELAEINKTGVIWLSTLYGWPPIKVDAGIPAHRPFNLEVYGEWLATQDAAGGLRNVMVLYYLDLSLLFLRLGDPLHCDFRYRVDPVTEPVALQAYGKTEPFDIYDLQYREGTSSVHLGGLYRISEPMEILGKYKDLERLQPLKILYPFLDVPEAAEFLVLTPKVAPPPEEKRIIPLYQ